MYHRGIVWMAGSLMARCELDAYRRRSVLTLIFASGCWTNWSERQPAIIGESCHKYHFCRDKRVFVRQKTSFVTTKICMSRQKLYFWQLPPMIANRFCQNHLLFLHPLVDCGGLANEQHSFHRKPLRFAPPPCCGDVGRQHQRSLDFSVCCLSPVCFIVWYRQ